ncbi:MAG: hypothetical protein DLM64_09220 [Solirubrobacterales bacterium]|nr:MAG: hypothetical protein DLM64_09220 [Solirubrobacterales bacterium]
MGLLVDRVPPAAAPQQAWSVTRRPASAGSGLDGFELLALAAFAAVSMWVVFLDLRQDALRGLVWTGIDGEFPVDQMQYLAWVQDASRHLLASDLFWPRSSAGDYLQPMVALSGGLAALGVAPWLALLVWKPVAVGAMFYALRAFYRRVLPGAPQRRAGLALGLFAATWGTLGDEWIPFVSWGYLYGLVALAAVLGALVAYDRTRRDGRGAWWAPALGWLGSWLHPWQGELLILVVVGAELLGLRRSPTHRSGRRLALPAATVCATALPLAYYAILQYSDPAWGRGDVATRHHAWSLGSAVWPLAPLLIAAALAYRRRPAGFLAVATRVWPLATLAVWALSTSGLGATPLHAWLGITIPLGALAVEGIAGLRWSHVPGRRALAVLAVASVTVPGSIHLMSAAPAYVNSANHGQNLITSSENRAFRYLALAPQAGAVLSSYYLGDAVPGETGRRTYVGDYRWSVAGYSARERTTLRLLDGRLTGGRARAFVLSTAARFVLAGCTSTTGLSQTLQAITRAKHRFGCASVYEIGARGRTARIADLDVTSGRSPMFRFRDRDRGTA